MLAFEPRFIDQQPTLTVNRDSEMTTKQTGLSLAFGILWAMFMIWWSADYAVANVVIFAVMGVILGFLWTWFMKHFRYFKI
jgi:hypothetical protein